MQHGMRKNKPDYLELSLRLADEMEKLPQEYKTGKQYEAYRSIQRHEGLFIARYEFMGFYNDIKRIIKRILIWIKSKRTEERIKQ